MLRYVCLPLYESPVKTVMIEIFLFQKEHNDQEIRFIQLQQKDSTARKGLLQGFALHTTSPHTEAQSIHKMQTNCK